MLRAVAAVLAPFVRALKLHDAARELGLHRSQLGTAHRGSPGDRADPPGRLASRPEARNVMDAARHAVARAEEPLGRHVLRGAVGRVECRDLADRARAQALEVEQAAGLERLERLRGLCDRDDERRSSRCLAHRGEHLSARLVGIVHDEEQRPARAAGSAEYLMHRPRRPVAGRVEHRRAVSVRVGGQLRDQARLAHSLAAGEHDHPPGAGARLVPAVPQPLQLGVPPEERWCGRHVELVRQRLRRGHRQGGVVVQDRVLQRAKLIAGLDAGLAGEPLPRLVVRLERLRLPPAPVERQHEVAGEPLARGMLGDHPPQLCDQLGMPAGREVRLDARLDGGLLLLLEPRDLDLGERLECQVREWRPAPQRERLAQNCAGFLRPAGRQRGAALLDQLLEALGVELARLDVEPVARRRGLEQLLVAERLAQPGDVDLDRLRRAGRCVLAPERHRDPLSADRLVRLEQQHRQDGPPLRPRYIDRPEVAVHLKRAKDPEVHRRARDATGLRSPLEDLH